MAEAEGLAVEAMGERMAALNSRLGKLKEGEAALAEQEKVRGNARPLRVAVPPCPALALLTGPSFRHPTAHRS